MDEEHKGAALLRSTLLDGAAAALEAEAALVALGTGVASAEDRSDLFNAADGCLRRMRFAADELGWFLIEGR